MKSSSCLRVASPNATPFLISVQDALLLDNSEGFHILRQHLSDNLTHDFCDQHGSCVEDRKAWTIMRDILHALLAPVVALHDHASHIARRSLGLSRPEDFEFAFSGNARNAFVWLQSFLSSEQEWCLSNGCPGCVVSQGLDNEEALRLLLASCLLSSIQGSSGMGRPALPSFEFFMRAVAQAMCDDELWGADFYEYLEPKALDLYDAVRVLIYQCQTMEARLTPPATPDSIENMEQCIFVKQGSTTAGMPIRRSQFAKRQATMLREEAKWLKEVAQSCWDSIESPTTEFERGLPTISTES